MASGHDTGEYDYMSDEFLQKCTDVRPGLVSQRIAKQLDREKKQTVSNMNSKTKPIKVQEHEKREEALGKAIGTENKGFALLEKMGFKMGMALGKTGNKGRTDPVPISLKEGRGGLGRDMHLKRKQDEIASFRQRMKAKQAKRYVENQRDFRHRMSSLMSEKRTHQDLKTSQKVCEQLDRDRKGMDEPVHEYFWPAHLLKKKKEAEGCDDDGEDASYYHLPGRANKIEDDDEETEEPVGDELEQLKELTAYLRKTYFYCIWCGTAYDDSEDLDDNCPGDTAEAHD